MARGVLAGGAEPAMRRSPSNGASCWGLSPCMIDRKKAAGLGGMLRSRGRTGVPERAQEVTNDGLHR